MLLYYCHLISMLFSLFRELFDRCPNQHTSLLLGDAYMAIQEVSQIQ